jgi:hypothetical protein
MIEEVIETRGFARKNEDGREADRRLANRLTRRSGSLRFGASSWSVGSIWGKSGPPSFAHASRELHLTRRMVSSGARSAKEDGAIQHGRQPRLTVSVDHHIDSPCLLAICLGTDLARSSIVFPPKRFVYVRRSLSHPRRFYTGVTANVRARLPAHNAANASTPPSTVRGKST